MQPNFHPVAWIQQSNIYEVNLRQYTQEGTIQAFKAHLPRLKAMGVDCLWMMPITPISREKRLGSLGSYYACSDYKAINPEFGTIGDFRLLVKEVHQLGMKLIIDWVANHTGWDHIWTQTHPEYYKKNATGSFYDNHGWADVIDLNYYDQSMRTAMIDAMQFWIDECDIDGFRCDMAHLVPLDFWRQARLALDSRKPLFWLAETEDWQYMDVFDCCYAWNWMHQTRKLYAGEISVTALRQELEAYQLRNSGERFQLFFTSNHDENSWNGTEYEKYGDAALALAVFSITWNGLPLIYSGQELPNTKRLAFFDKDQIEWNGKPALEDFYTRLLQLRTTHPAMSTGNSAVPLLLHTDVDDQVLAFRRKLGEQEILVMLNLSGRQQDFHLSNNIISGSFRDLFTGRITDFGNNAAFSLDPWQYMVLSK